MSNIIKETQHLHQQQHNVVALNNQGMAYLVYGMAGQAVISFRNALKLISDLSCSTTGGDAFESLSFHARPLSQELLLKNKNTQSALMSNAILLNTSVYELTIHQRQDENANNTVDNIAAAVLFNLGLAYHLTAIYTGGDVSFERALKMYRLAAETLHRHGENPQDMAASKLGCLLAVYNNQAHASLHFLNLTLAQTSLEAVRFLLSFCPQHDMETDWYQLYRINVVCTDLFSAAPAA